MKSKKKVLPAVLMCFAALGTGGLLVGCGPQDPGTLQYTVTFETNGGSEIAPVKVDKNKRVTKPADPTRGTDTFKGWFKDNNTFSDAWNFDVNIVTKDITLYADWLTAYEYPTAIGLKNEVFSKTLVWSQKDVAQATTTFVVKIGGEEKAGSWTYDAQNQQVSFVLDDDAVVGAQEVVIETTRTDWTGADAIQNGTATVKFSGNGTQAAPYTIYKNTAQIELEAITGDVNFDTNGKYFALGEDVKFESLYTAKNDKVFKGHFDGNDKQIAFSGTTNEGVFHEIAEGATFKNTKFAGTVSTTRSLFAPVTTHNKGTVSGIYTFMQIVCEEGVVGQRFSGNVDDIATFVGGGAGVVGVNYATGVVSDCEMKTSSSSETLKVSNGGGGIVAINYGEISNCLMNGCLGAYNTYETGKSNSKYSFLGGIAAYNYGKITDSEISGTGKILAQRYQDNSTAANIGIGGIAAVNGATGEISGCKVSALRVHGDTYVGGVAGINAGKITTSEVGFDFFSYTGSDGDYTAVVSYVGGRNHVGGIAGLTEGTGTVSNCLFAGNVYAHNSSSDATKQWALAENASNSVYVDHNLNARTVSNHQGNIQSAHVLMAPTTGTNNVAIAVAEGSNQTEDYVMAENASALAALNTGLATAAFAYDETNGIRLV